jgi:hypothetical protein
VNPPIIVHHVTLGYSQFNIIDETVKPWQAALWGNGNNNKIPASVNNIPHVLDAIAIGSTVNAVQKLDHSLICTYAQSSAYVSTHLHCVT